jgi:hypothetical protein
VTARENTRVMEVQIAEYLPLENTPISRIVWYRSSSSGHVEIGHCRKLAERSSELQMRWVSTTCAGVATVGALKPARVIGRRQAPGT